MHRYFALIFSFAHLLAEGQSFELGSWNIVNAKYNAKEIWSLFGEAKLRSLKTYDQFPYYEYKGGINFRTHKNSTLTAAAGSYQTY
jgi:hypothetical protein